MANSISKERWQEIKHEFPNRTSSMMYRYFEIVQKHYKNCTRYEAKLETHKQDSSVYIGIEEYMQNEYSKIKVIVFSGLFLEAVINDYGASNLSDTYFKKHLDKLRFVSKWAIIPKLITGKKFPTDSQAFELLVKLNKSRNYLVHYKTRKIPDTYEEYMEFIQKENIEINRVEDAYKCIAKCLLELSKIDNTKWQLFTSDTFSKIISGEVIW